MFVFTIWRATGVEYEYRFAWITKTAGTCQTAARLSPSCVSPTEKRALAEERHRDAGLAAALEGERGAGDDRHEVAEHRDEREDAVRRRAEMHVAVAAERRARRLAEEVAEHVGGVAPRAKWQASSRLSGATTSSGPSASPAPAATASWPRPV